MNRFPAKRGAPRPRVPGALYLREQHAIHLKEITAVYTTETGIVDQATNKHPLAGDVFFMDATIQELWNFELTKSPRYHAPSRLPIMIAVPTTNPQYGQLWCPDTRANNDPLGWIVTGYMPLWTVVASIRTGDYHGSITRGVMTPYQDSKVMQ